MSKMKNDIRFRIEQGKGLSATDALKLNYQDIRSLSRQELAYMVSTIASAANKRIDRLSRAGQPIEDHIERFSVAGKNRNELLRELSRERRFMQNERQSLSGQARIRKEVAAELAKQESFTKRELNKFFSDQDRYDKFWRAWDIIKDKNKIVNESGKYKYRTLKELKNMMLKYPGDSKEEIAERMQNVVDQAYMDTQEERTEVSPGDVFTYQGRA